MYFIAFIYFFVYSLQVFLAARTISFKQTFSFLFLSCYGFLFIWHSKSHKNFSKCIFSTELVNKQQEKWRISAWTRLTPRNTLRLWTSLLLGQECHRVAAVKRHQKLSKVFKCFETEVEMCFSLNNNQSQRKIEDEYFICLICTC